MAAGHGTGTEILAEAEGQEKVQEDVQEEVQPDAREFCRVPEGYETQKPDVLNPEYKDPHFRV